MQKEKILSRLYEIMDDGPWQSQQDFCESVGITPQILCNLKREDYGREVPKSLLIGLARLQYNITWFLYGVGPMKIYGSVNEEVLKLRHQIETLQKIKQALERAEDANAESIQSEDDSRGLVSMRRY